jgi:hypothetical protein
VLLADSSYPLRALSRQPEAAKRIAAALNVLLETKDYPAAKITLDAEAYTVMRAQADDLAATGHLGESVRAYEQLLARLSSSLPAATADLRSAMKLSDFYDTLGALYRRSGQTAKADDIASRLGALSSLTRAFRSSK